MAKRPAPRWGILLSLGLMVAPLLSSLVAFARRDGREPFLQMAETGTACVREPDLMRREHWVYLTDLRDRVVRSSRRPPRESLEAAGMRSCPRCHANRTAFCDKCHERAGVKPDCFGCHSY